jgi:hypothetical protein
MGLHWLGTGRGLAKSLQLLGYCFSAVMAGKHTASLYIARDSFQLHSMSICCLCHGKTKSLYQHRTGSGILLLRLKPVYVCVTLFELNG